VLAVARRNRGTGELAYHRSATSHPGVKITIYSLSTKTHGHPTFFESFDGPEECQVAVQRVRRIRDPDTT
jgi:hypothetical protein